MGKDWWSCLRSSCCRPIVQAGMPHFFGGSVVETMVLKETTDYTLRSSEPDNNSIWVDAHGLNDVCVRTRHVVSTYTASCCNVIRNVPAQGLIVVLVSWCCWPTLKKHSPQNVDHDLCWCVVETRWKIRKNTDFQMLHFRATKMLLSGPLLWLLVSLVRLVMVVVLVMLVLVLLTLLVSVPVREEKDGCHHGFEFFLVH